jgi:hypothetical protein
MKRITKKSPINATNNPGTDPRKLGGVIKGVLTLFEIEKIASPTLISLNPTKQRIIFGIVRGNVGLYELANK